MVDQITFTFRLSIYSLLLLSSLTIGLAEGNVFPHLVSLPLIIFTFMSLDDRPWLKPDGILTSFLGLVALLVAFWEFQLGRVNVEMRILAASHLLAYFSWIVLLMEKKSQQYWWMLALSMLNMGVSASLTNSAALGFSVVIYLLLAIWTLAIFTAYRGTAYLRNSSEPGPGEMAAASVAPSRAYSSGRPQTQSPAALIQQKSLVRGGFYFDPSDSWVGLRLMYTVLYIAIASSVVGLMLFTITPRIWIGNFELPSTSEEALNFGRSVAGFTSEVQLGDLGEVLSNPTPVMSVTFENMQSGEQLRIEDATQFLNRQELLFRGTALTNYQNGRWSEGPKAFNNVLRSNYGNVRRNAMRINYELEPIGRETIFCVNPVSMGRVLNTEVENPVLVMDMMSHDVQFPGNRQFQSLSVVDYESIIFEPKESSRSGFYEYRTSEDLLLIQVQDRVSESIEDNYRTGIQDITQPQTDFAGIPLGRFARKVAFLFDTYHRSLLEVDRERLQSLVNLAEELCVDDQGDTLEPLERCQTLYNYLKNSGNFSYTLEMSIEDPTIDPIEDFLLVRKAGHCEYFASAMTLMLRAVGIPARMVTGFRHGDWEEDEQRLVVKQSHAHAWVEALIDGRWHVVDPTTAASEDDEISVEFSTFSLAYIQSRLTAFWQSYILNVSLADQDRNIYEPMQNSAMSTMDMLAQKKNEIREFYRTGAPTRYTMLNRLIMFAVTFLPFLLIPIIVGLLLFRDRLRHFLNWLMPQRHRNQKQKMILFFRKFLDVAARQGLSKQPQQTPLEFAQSFQQKFATQLNQIAMTDLPVQLTDAYYQVRYRGVILPETDLKNWEEKIDQLWNSLQSVNKR